MPGVEFTFTPNLTAPGLHCHQAPSTTDRALWGSSEASPLLFRLGSATGAGMEVCSGKAARTASLPVCPCSDGFQWSDKGLCVWPAHYRGRWNRRESRSLAARLGPGWTLPLLSALCAPWPELLWVTNPLGAQPCTAPETSMPRPPLEASLWWLSARQTYSSGIKWWASQRGRTVPRKGPVTL